MKNRFGWVLLLALAACGDGSAAVDPAAPVIPTATPQATPTTVPGTAAGYVSGCGTQTSNLTASKVYYVSPSGPDTGAGTSFSEPMSLSGALSVVSAGQMVLLAPGTYPVAYTAGAKNTITLAQSGTADARIYLVAADCGRAVIDFQFPEKAWVQDSFGFYLTGNYWYFKGIAITRAGYQGAYVTGGYNTFENVAFYDNRNSGLEINKGGHHTLVINTDSYRNYDPKKHGSMADGFASKQTQGAGNFFWGCRAWENSDDGWDTYDSAESVVIENSWTFGQGYDYWGDSNYAGNGNGFKLGGNYKQQNNRISNSVSFGNRVKGFDQNNNTGGVTLYNNVSYRNGINYGFGNGVNAGQQHVFRNNISLASSTADVIDHADSAHNSWNGGLGVSDADFSSLDLEQAKAPRHADGTLPDTQLFRLRSGSKLVNAGVNVGLPYLGVAPDLGAFERE